jgi:hypothetical protein
MTWGIYDQIITDPGSDIMSAAVTTLNKWLSVEHLVSLVGRHESNGVEGTNKQILRHLRTLVHDERNDQIKRKWGSPSVYKAVEFFINTFDHTEAGIIPIHARLGSDVLPYANILAHIPQSLDDNIHDNMHDYIKQLDENLRYIGEKSAQFQRELVARRLKDVDISKQNIYKEGDFVLRRDPAPLHKNKLAFRWAGPYMVMHDQKGNDVTCRNLVTDVVYVFYVGELKIFVGTKEQAMEAAMLDDDQFRVK